MTRGTPQRGEVKQENPQMYASTNKFSTSVIEQLRVFFTLRKYLITA